MTLKVLQAGVPPLLVGPAGCGKTSIGKQIADKLNLKFYYSGAVDSAFQLRGFKDAHGNTARTPFREAYEHGGVFLFDELDASDPNAIVSLHAALDNGVLDAPDGMIPKHKDFHYIAAANTWGQGATLDYMGRNAMDGATLDRYGFLEVDYDPDLELKIALDKYPNGGKAWMLVVQQARQACRDLQLRHIVSTRAVKYGAALRAAGIEFKHVLGMTVLKGLPKEDQIKLTKKLKDYATKTAGLIKPELFRDIDSKVGVLNDQFTRIANAEAKVDKICKEAQERSGQLSTKMAQTTASLQELQTAGMVMDGINMAVPGIVKAVEKALKTLKQPPPTPSGP